MNIHDGHREKMRRRFIKGGLEGFADHEALELLLYYAIPRRDTNPIAHMLMNRYGSLSAVLNAPIEDLQKVDGIGESSAVLLHLAGQIYQKARLAELAQEQPLASIEAVGRYLLARYDGEKHEVIYQICLDGKGKLLACKRLNEGDGGTVTFDLRKIVENALLTNAVAVVLAHNHPSGVALPSDDDYTATRRVQEALETIGVMLVDHVIVADHDYVSMRESNYLR